MEKGEFIFLGTGASSGVPMIGCTCQVCLSTDQRNKRLRPAGLIKLKNKQLLIDCGPDFRFQALRQKIYSIDGLLLTHSHFDHIAGIDEMRIYYLRSQKPLPVLISQSSYDDLSQRYYYLFKPSKTKTSLTAQLEFHVLEHTRGNRCFLDVNIGYMQFEQAGMIVTGYRFGTFAYISDIKNYPETIFEDLSGVHILVLGVLKKEASPIHFTVEEGVNFAKKVGAKKTYFTHLGHELDYSEINAFLPAGIELAFDGLRVQFVYG